MELILDTIEGMLYIHGEVFWLKECLTVFKSALIFLFFFVGNTLGVKAGSALISVYRYRRCLYFFG